MVLKPFHSKYGLWNFSDSTCMVTVILVTSLYGWHNVYYNPYEVTNIIILLNRYVTSETWNTFWCLIRSPTSYYAKICWWWVTIGDWYLMLVPCSWCWWRDLSSIFWPLLSIDKNIKYVHFLPLKILQKFIKSANFVSDFLKVLLVIYKL